MILSTGWGGGLLPGVPGPGGSAPGGHAWSGGGGLLLGGVPGGDPPGTATAAGGTHPTGMHSCYIIQFQPVSSNFALPNYENAFILKNEGFSS